MITKELNIGIAIKNTVTFLLLLLSGQQLLAQSTGYNYIRTRIPNKALTTSAQMDALMSNKDSVQTQIIYLDGLGRHMQTVQMKGSPLGNDMVQAFAFDSFGKESMKYLPYTSTSTGYGTYRTDALTAGAGVSQFYNPSGNVNTTITQQANGVVNTAYPYAVTGFEASSLNRVVEQGAPGATWQLPGAGDANSTGHTGRTIYTTNDQVAFLTAITNNPGCRRVVYYRSTVNATGGQTLIRDANTYYGSGLLSVTIYRDENWQPANGGFGTTETYKDKEGRLILSRRYNISGTTAQMLSTYYVYDDFGNLAYVLPPAANADASVPTQSILDNLCYQYQYDQRNRPIQKKIPGKGWQYMIYNKLDQVIATQDSSQRMKSPQQVSYFKYDALGRAIVAGYYTITGTSGTNYRTTLQTSANNQTILWETRLGGSYSNSTIPTSNATMLVTNYYDDYNITGLPTTCIIPAGAGAMAKALPTATVTAVLNTPANLLWKVNFYDNLGRVIQIYAQHYLSGVSSPNNYDVAINTYNFTNQLMASTRNHYNTTSTSSPVVTIANTYNYDHIGRKKQTWEQINGAANVLLVDAEYNEIGQLMTKNLHALNGGGQGDQANIALSSANTSGTFTATSSITMSTGFSVVSGATFTAQIAAYLQSINYSYNERGWLLSSTAPLFQEQLQYNSVNSVTGVAPVAQYNGNIASQSWGNGAIPNSNSYVYAYDNLNRLLGGTSATTHNDESNITYDLNGNIKTLIRSKAGATVDNLQYTYITNTNQLQLVTDNSGSNLGLSNLATNYLYDANGNLLSGSNTTNASQNKSITYNMLNQPLVVTVPLGTVSYSYDAMGKKLRKVSVISGNTTTTDYVDGIQYNSSGNIDFIQTEEGRALNSNGNYHYEYTIADHLGNARLSFDTYTGSASIVQQDDYYPFGGEISTGTNVSPKNEYLYNSKELQEEFNQYDYGARPYDPVIGRWTTIDPLLEISRRWSPYSYGENNPIRNVDVDGLWTNVGGDGITTSDAGDIATLAEQIKSGGGNEQQFDANAYVDNILNGSTPEPGGEDKGNANQGGPGARPSDAWFLANGWDKAPWYGNFLGPGPSKDPYSLIGPDGRQLRPIDMLDAAAQTHDYYYNLASTGGISGALFSHGTADADEQLAKSAQQVISFFFNHIQDPVSHIEITESEYHWALGVVLLFYQTAGWKSLDK